MAADVDQSRTVVKTYLPAYQKEVWVKHADELGMSLSEFVRTMVQAGRRGFEGSDEPRPDAGNDDDTIGLSTDPDDLEDRVLTALSAEDPRSWEEIRHELTGGFDEHLERALQSLQSGGHIVHSPRRGGYVRSDADE